MAYNVRSMQSAFDERIEKVKSDAAELDHVNSVCKQIASIVQSEDSDLASTWNTLGNNYGKCNVKTIRVSESLKKSVDEFAKETVAAEQASSSANQAIASALSDNSDQLDALDI